MAAEPRCGPERLHLMPLWHRLLKRKDDENWDVTIEVVKDLDAIELRFRNRRSHPRKLVWCAVLTLSPEHGMAISYPKSHLRGTTFAGRIFRLARELSPARNYEHAVEYARTVVKELRAVLDRHPEDIMML